jgi:hypothetical protein
MGTGDFNRKSTSNLSETDFKREAVSQHDTDEDEIENQESHRYRYFDIFIFVLCGLFVTAASFVAISCDTDPSHCSGSLPASFPHWLIICTCFLFYSLFVRMIFSRTNYLAIFGSVFITMMYVFTILGSSYIPVASQFFIVALALIVIAVHIFFSQIFAPVSEQHNTFAYDHAGYGPSRRDDSTQPNVNPNLPPAYFSSVDVLGAEIRNDMDSFASFFELLGYFLTKSGMSDEMCRLFLDDFFIRLNFQRVQTDRAESLVMKGRNYSDSDIRRNDALSEGLITGIRQLYTMFYVLATVLFFDEKVNAGENSLLSDLKKAFRINDADFFTVLLYVGNENSMYYDTFSREWVSSSFKNDNFDTGEEYSERRSKVDIDADVLKRAYQVLRISPDETNENVRKAYLRMISRYHPDRVHALNLEPEKSAEMQALYHQITAEVNDAWSVIKRARSIN